MTTKTRQTLAMIDRLAGIPHIMARSDNLVVPHEAWTFFDLRQPDDRFWWQTGRGKYDSGLLFKLK